MNKIKYLAKTLKQQFTFDRRIMHITQKIDSSLIIFSTKVIFIK